MSIDNIFHIGNLALIIPNGLPMDCIYRTTVIIDGEYQAISLRRNKENPKQWEMFDEL